MRKMTKAILLSLVLCVGLLSTACPQRESIANIEANPSKFYNKEVGIAGTVRDSYGLNIPLTQIRGGVYKVDDGTGSIWVATQMSVPSKGAKVGVKGKIQNGVNFNGKNYGLGMIEEDRRVK
ncbi:MAG: hypothetical protein H0X15_07325 [Acidobacteria bacterium]|jgi:hypothetical protein|nr:hypothetical protein [Acidobacteriota bacterium]